MTDAAIEIHKRTDLSHRDIQQVDSLERSVFGDPQNWQYRFASPDWYVLARVGEEVAAQIAIFERTAMVDGIPVKLAGIGGVATVPRWRKRGFATAALVRAAGFMRNELDAEFGLLICSSGLVSLYREVGWQVVNGPLVFDQPTGKVTFQDVVMVLQLRNRKWREGLIDLCGLPW